MDFVELAPKELAVLALQSASMNRVQVIEVAVTVCRLSRDSRIKAVLGITF